MYKMLLISILSLYQPLFVSMDRGLDCPIALIGCDNALNNFQKKFFIRPEIITSSMLKKQIENIFLSANSTSVIVMNEKLHEKKAPSSKYQSICEMAFDVTALHQLNQEPIITTVIVALGQILPESCREKMIPISATSLELEKSYNLEWDYLPNEQDITFITEIYDKITENRKNIEDNFKWIYMSAACLYVALKRSNRLEEYDEVLKQTKELEDEIKTYRDENIINEVVTYIGNYIIENDTFNIYQLPRLDDEFDGKWSESIFIKGDNMYLEEELLKQMLKSYPIDMRRIKERLASEEILIKEDLSYTPKMTYYLNGNTKRKRMLKFNMSLMEIEGISMKEYMESCI